MKNLSIFGVHRKISFRGVHKKTVYIGGLAEKGGLGQFADLRGLGKKDGVVFLMGLIPQCTLQGFPNSSKGQGRVKP